MAKAKKAAVADPAADGRRLVAELAKTQFCGIKKHSTMPAAKAILTGPPELQAAAAREAIELFARLRDRISSRSAMTLLNVHFQDGYSEPVSHLLRDLFKRSTVPLSDRDLARAMAVFARYEHLMLSLLPIAALLAFAERAASRGPLDEKTRRNAARIAKALLTAGRAAEGRASERFAALANAG
jgi:hypothetical protein